MLQHQKQLRLEQIMFQCGLERLKLKREKEFKDIFWIRFDQLKNKFGHSYRIDVSDEDDGFGRIHMMVVKVVKTDAENLEIASVGLRFSGIEPLSREVIQEIHTCLLWNRTKDLGTV